MYLNYAVMLVGSELDTQSKVLNLTKMLHDMEKHHDVLLAHAKGVAVPSEDNSTGVPSVDDVRTDREALQAATKTVVDYRHRIIAHLTPLGAPEIPLAQLDDALRALRKTLIKYNGVLKASDLLSATPVPHFDWLAPYRMAWISEGFEEPEDEEEARMSEEEKKARREHRKKWGFGPC